MHSKPGRSARPPFMNTVYNHFEQSFQVSCDFSSLLGIGKIRAQLKTCQIISNVDTKGKTCVEKFELECHEMLRGEPSDIFFSHFSSLIAVGFYLTELTTILQCK